MERHELRELVEDALEALKPRYQRTRTPFNLQTIREEVEDQHGAPLADDDAAQIPGIMQRLWERRWGIEPAAIGGGSAMRRHPTRVKYDRSIPSPPPSPVASVSHQTSASELAGRTSVAIDAVI